MLRSDHSAFFPFGSFGLLALSALLGAFAVGCSPKIGDKCTVSTDCSATGDRLCDITEPGGYCTVFNCEPDGCPDEALCINFGTELSPVNGCTASQGNSPYERSFCLAACSSNSDCRSGYDCVEPKRVGGVNVDYTRSGTVCAVLPISKDPAEAGSLDGASAEVCMGSDAGLVAKPGAGGASSTGGASSAADSGSLAAGASGGGASGADDAGAGG